MNIATRCIITHRGNSRGFYAHRVWAYGFRLVVRLTIKGELMFKKHKRSNLVVWWLPVVVVDEDTYDEMYDMW